MTYQTPATLTDEERDYLVSALQERGITPEKWEEGVHNIKMLVELVNDNRDYLERLVDYIRREAEKDPRQGAAVFEDDYLENILKRAIDSMESPGDLPPIGYLMNGGQLQTLTRVFTSGGSPRRSEVTRSEKWKVEEYNDSENPAASNITFTRKNRGVTYSITLTNPDLFFPGTTRDKRKRGTQVTRKLLPFVLQKMTQQGYPDVIRIDLGELVRLRAYKNEDSAYNGITRFLKQMQSMDLAWTRVKKVKENGKVVKKEVSGEGGSLFYHRRRQNNTAFIYVNKQFDLHELKSQYTVFPDWAYALGPLAFDLVRYVFYIARVNKKEVAETGTFNISLMAVLYAVGLPTPEDVTGRKYRQLIRKPIEDAITEIELRVAEVPEAKGRFFLTPHVNYSTTDIHEWLDGYIEVELRDEYVTLFSHITDKQREKIERKSASKSSRTGNATPKGKGE